ncbi:transcriptional regulator [Neisseria sp. N95_16]|uniref:Transcriptional regulator n=1 Tax=Neisseria brasiliensis TaxID=2666100 RepID=A0A7X2GZI4_9NEIS|nr:MULTISPECIES: pyocin activator PrtN family protein [Neisseria]MRN38559.1 transcriptional regulator [Neisseria brasiliensis]PJO10478.1 transcriptional regulator [Neisseria sp. N95_16]
MNMPTQQKLLLIYGKTHITLEQAVNDWIPHINVDTARRRAKAQTLPWPVIASEESQKSSCFVSISAIAEWLDQREEKAKEAWDKIHN